MKTNKLAIIWVIATTTITVCSAQNTETPDPYSLFGKTHVLGDELQTADKIFVIRNFPPDSPVDRIEHHTRSGIIKVFGKDGKLAGEKQLTDTENAWTTPDPLAEKYYSISPYAYCGNNPLKYIDMRGDSLTLVGSNVQETLLAIYNGLQNGTSTTMKFNNGILDPSSIAENAQGTSDSFLQDLYEISVNPTMVELSVSNRNTYMINSQRVEENFVAPYDYHTSLDPQAEAWSKAMGEPTGLSIQGNLGQTLVPGKSSLSGKNSTNKNIQVIINGKGSLNHQTVGMAHEFGHVVLYLRGLPYGHTQKGVDPFIYNRSTIMSKKLGYDF